MQPALGLYSLPGEQLQAVAYFKPKEEISADMKLLGSMRHGGLTVPQFSSLVLVLVRREDSVQMSTVLFATERKLCFWPVSVD